jgi:hypothetical protein
MPPATFDATGKAMAGWNMNNIRAAASAAR